MGITDLTAGFSDIQRRYDAMNILLINLLINPDSLTEPLIRRGALSAKFAEALRKSHTTVFNALSKQLMKGDFTVKPVLRNVPVLLFEVQNLATRLMPLLARGPASPAFTATAMAALTAFLAYHSVDHNALAHLADQMSQAGAMIKNWPAVFHHEDAEALSADMD